MAADTLEISANYQRASTWRQLIKRVAAAEAIVVGSVAIIAWLAAYPFDIALGLTGLMLIDLGVVSLACSLVLASDDPAANQSEFTDDLLTRSIQMSALGRLDRWLRLLDWQLTIMFAGIISLTIGLLIQTPPV